MDDLTFPQAFTVLLKLHEHPTTAAQILTAMEAPYLFLQRDGHYIAGNGFLSPKWLHMYLRPLGLQLMEHTFSRVEVSTFLKNNAPATRIIMPNVQRKPFTAAVSPQKRLISSAGIKKTASMVIIWERNFPIIFTFITKPSI